MAISCEKFSQMLEVISKEHKIPMEALILSLETKDLLPKKMVKSKPLVTKDKNPFDNKRAQEFADTNNVCIEGIVGTGRGGRITIGDMKKVGDISVVEKVKISDAAAKLAKENKIDITKITPSGKRGDILVKDIKVAIEQQPEQSIVVEEEEEDFVLNTQEKEKPELELEESEDEEETEDEEEPELELEESEDEEPESEESEDEEEPEIELED